MIGFTGVFLEGMEVVLIELSLGLSSGRLGAAVAAAGAAVAVVTAAGLVVARQRAEGPANAMKMALGVMLVSVGTFWSGAGVRDPLAGVRRSGPGAHRRLRGRHRPRRPHPPAPPARRQPRPRAGMTPATVVRAFGRFWWEVLVGGTPELALGTVAAGAGRLGGGPRRRRPSGAVPGRGDPPARGQLLAGPPELSGRPRGPGADDGGVTAAGGPAAPIRPLPAALLTALRDEEVVRVTSRDGPHRGTVPMWFAIQPPGILYLFTHAFSRKAERWRRDPWVRLRPPADGPAVEGTVHFVEGPELERVIEMVVERWAMAGATTPEALRRMVAEGSHALLRVEARAGRGGRPTR